MGIRELNTTSKTAFLAAFVVVVMASCGPSHGPGATKVRVNPVNLVNLIQDPDFGNGPPRELDGGSVPWHGEEPRRVSIVNDGHAYSGSQEADMHDGDEQLFQLVDVAVNTSYTLTAWVAGTPALPSR